MTQVPSFNGWSAISYSKREGMQARSPNTTGLDLLSLPVCSKTKRAPRKRMLGTESSNNSSGMVDSQMQSACLNSWPTFDSQAEIYCGTCRPCSPSSTASGSAGTSRSKPFQLPGLMLPACPVGSLPSLQSNHQAQPFTPRLSSPPQTSHPTKDLLIITQSPPIIHLYPQNLGLGPTR